MTTNNKVKVSFETQLPTANMTEAEIQRFFKVLLTGPAASHLLRKAVQCAIKAPISQGWAHHE